MAKEEDYKFGVEDLADKLGIEPASARIKLRNAGIKKTPAGRYGWKTKEELAKVADELGKVKAAPAKKADTKNTSKGKDDPKASKGAGKADAKGKDAKADSKSTKKKS